MCLVCLLFEDMKQDKNHLMHLQVGVWDPHLGFQKIDGIGCVAFQTATFLQVGLELLPAPPKG